MKRKWIYSTAVMVFVASMMAGCQPQKGQNVEKESELMTSQTSDYNNLESDNTQTENGIQSETILEETESEVANANISDFWLYYTIQDESFVQMLYRVSSNGDVEPILEYDSQEDLYNAAMVHDGYMYYIAENQIRKTQIGTQKEELVREVEFQRGGIDKINDEYWCNGLNNDSSAIDFYHYSDSGKDFTLSGLPNYANDVMVSGNDVYTIHFVSYDHTFFLCKASYGQNGQVQQIASVENVNNYSRNDECIYLQMGDNTVQQLDLDGNMTTIFTGGQMVSDPIYTFDSIESIYVYENTVLINELYLDAGDYVSFTSCFDRETGSVELIELREEDAQNEMRISTMLNIWNYDLADLKFCNIGNTYYGWNTDYVLEVLPEKDYICETIFEAASLNTVDENDQEITYSLLGILPYEDQLFIGLSCSDESRSGLYYFDLETKKIGEQILNFEAAGITGRYMSLLDMTEISDVE